VPKKLKKNIKELLQKVPKQQKDKRCSPEQISFLFFPEQISFLFYPEQISFCFTQNKFLFAIFFFLKKKIKDKR